MIDYGIDHQAVYDKWRKDIALASSIVEERETTHGPYTKTAHAAQQLKAYLRTMTNWGILPDEQKEALEMIMHKVARIGEGKSTHKDHWDDIAGYAGLGGKATY